MAQAQNLAATAAHDGGGAGSSLAEKIGALREALEAHREHGVVIEPDGLVAICGLLESFEDEARALDGMRAWLAPLGEPSKGSRP